MMTHAGQAAARGRAILPLFAALMMLGSAGFAGDSLPPDLEWQELGPAPVYCEPPNHTIDCNDDLYAGRVSAIACSRIDLDLYYAAGADGGVWRSRDGGLSWSPLTDQMPTSAIGALALDPIDESVVYAGTGEANFATHSRYGLGLYKSTDGGDTWTHLAEDVFGGRCFSRIIVSPADSQLVYAAVTRTGGVPELSSAKGHPGATGPVGIFHSEDGGVTWSQFTNGIPNLSATDLAMDPNDPSTLYAGVGRIYGDPANGVYKTTDGGESWTRLESGVPSGDGVGRISVAVAPSDRNRVYALVTESAGPKGGSAPVIDAYRSDNAGESWSRLHIPELMQATYGWYLSAIAVMPGNPDIAFMGGVVLYRTRNAGSTWRLVTPPHVDIHALEWDAAGRLVCGDDGGVHRSEDQGVNWVALNDGLGTIQFYAGLSTHPADAQFVVGGTQDNGTSMRGIDALTWTQVLGGDGGWTQVDQSDPNRLFVEFQGDNNVYRSQDGGATFQFSGSGIDGRNCFLPPYLIDPTDSSRMLHGTHVIHESLDGGDTWSAISGDLTNGDGAIRTLAMAPLDPSVVYAATNDGNVLVSFDGGAVWEIIADGVPGWPRTTREIFVDPIDPLSMYLAVAYYGQTQVRRTRDAGQTWEALDTTLPDIPVNTLAVDVRKTRPVIYAGTDSGVYRSLDDGDSWHRFGQEMPNAAVIDLRLDTARGFLVAATQGRGAWTIPIVTPVDGDLDGDGDVDLRDLAELLGGYNCAGGFCTGDIDGNGATDAEDLLTLLTNYGYTQ